MNILNYVSRKLIMFVIARSLAASAPIRTRGAQIELDAGAI